MGWGEMTALEAARARCDRGRPRKSAGRGLKAAGTMGRGHGRDDRQRVQQVPQGGMR